jgi:hypothetical protein
MRAVSEAAYSSAGACDATNPVVIPGRTKARTRNLETPGSTLNASPRNDGETSALDERLFDHEMAGLAVAAFEEGASLEHLLQLF